MDSEDHTAIYQPPQPRSAGEAVRWLPPSYCPVLLPGRKRFRGQLLSWVMHGALLVAAVKIADWMPPSKVPWFDWQAPITYLKLQGAGAGPPYTLIYFRPADSAELPRPTGQTEEPSGKLVRISGRIARPQVEVAMIGSPPEVRLPQARLRPPEVDVAALRTPLTGVNVAPPGLPVGSAGTANSTGATSLPEPPPVDALEPAQRGQNEVGLSLDPGLPLALLRPFAVQSPAIEQEVRLVHPESGQFDVVLLQSVPDVAMRVFKAAPAYSVYLNVGGRKPWILHFCPLEPNIQITEHVVRIGALEPLAAPYPRMTVVPVSLVDGVTGDPLAVSGVIDGTGHFGHLETVNTRDQDQSSRLLSFLTSWLFRPAKRNEIPVAVQVVLVIPAANEEMH